MSKEYIYTFKEIIENFDLLKLGTIIESDYGNKYKLTKTDNDTRKFSRVNKGLRFMTYDNIDKMFRIVEDEETIDIDEIEELEILPSIKTEGFENVNDYIKGTNKMHTQLVQKSDKYDIMSALVLREYLYSI